MIMFQNQILDQEKLFQYTSSGLAVPFPPLLQSVKFINHQSSTINHQPSI